MKNIVIFAGYNKLMNDLLNLNNGLKSRVSIHLNFEDYTLDELLKIIDTLIIKDTTTRENNIYDIINNLNIILNNNIFKRSLREARNNWLGISIEEVIDNVINYFKSMETVGI